MDIKLNQLGIFGTIATRPGGSGCDILQLSEDGKEAKVSAKYRNWNIIGRLGRSATTEAANNNTRTKLLEALASTFGYELERNQETGKTVFTQGFMDRLEKVLGKEVLERGNFGIGADGTVTSGSPLTERRITAIVNRVHELTNADKAQQKLQTLVGHVEGYMMIAGLRLGDQGGKSLSYTDMAKIVIALEEKTNDDNGYTVDTIGQFKELVETATGRKCAYTWAHNDEDRDSSGNAHFPHVEQVIRLMKEEERVASAKIVLSADEQVRRTSLKDSVAAANRKQQQLMMQALCEEVKQNPAYLNKNDREKAKADMYLGRLFDPNRPFPKTISAELLKFAALDMLANGTKPFVLRLALEAYDNTMNAGNMPSKPRSTAARLTNIAQWMAQNGTPGVMTQLQEIITYVSAHRNAPADPNPPAFMSDGVKDGVGGDEVRTLARLLFEMLRLENRDFQQMVSALKREDLEGLSEQMDQVSTTRMETIDESTHYSDSRNPKDIAKYAKLTLQSAILSVQQEFMNRIYATVAEEVGLQK